MPPEQLTQEEEAELDAWLKALKGGQSDRKNADAVALGELVRHTDQTPNWSDFEFAALQKRTVEKIRTDQARLRWRHWQPWALAATIGTLAVGLVLQQMPPKGLGSDYEDTVPSALEKSDVRSIQPQAIDPDSTSSGIQTLKVGNVDQAALYIQEQLTASGITADLIQPIPEVGSGARIAATIPKEISSGDLADLRSALRTLGLQVEPGQRFIADLLYDG